MNKPRTLLALAGATALGALVAACGGGGNDTPTGTLRLALTDAPACGIDNVWVTVQKVRVHKSSSAGDNDDGWSEVVVANPQRVDLLTLNNGTLVPLGQTPLPAGRYTQMRLVLAANGTAAPWANSIVPTGGAEQAMDTPSGQQSGLKMNIDLEVPADKVADFAIDFDACKSFVRAGNSGKILLKPVLAVLPILSDAGQRIVGWVDPALAASATSVSAQASGVPVRATPPDANGKFVLYPVPPGTVDVVVTAPGRANVVMTGVPVAASAPTTIGSETVRLVPPAASAPAAAASGVVRVNGSTAATGGVVRATQSLAGGPTIEVGSANADSVSGAWALTLPTVAAARTAYAASAAGFAFSADASTAGKYRLAASATGFTTPKTADIALPLAAPVDFVFP